MKKAIATIFSTLPIFLSSPVLAQATTSAPPKIEEIGSIISNAFNIILPAGIVIAVIMIIFGGYMWMMAAGDPGKTQQAQGTITWAVLGLVIIFLLRIILTLVFNTILSV